ncbi:MAG: nitroreductase/quinone reductase family protein [Dehalococcoidia bacterium]
MLRSIGNRLVRGLLASPLHGLLGAGILVITVTGRRSGKRYSTPVQCVARGNSLFILSHRARTWWRNLRQPAPVEVLHRGRHLRGTGRVLASDDTDALEALRGTMLGKVAERRGVDSVLLRVDLEAA